VPRIPAAHIDIFSDPPMLLKERGFLVSRRGRTLRLGPFVVLQVEQDWLGLLGRLAANKTRQWAIFVHGCFWHSHPDCRLASAPKSNTGYWREKLARNRERDAENIAALRTRGFRVLVIWECDVRDGTRLTIALGKFFPEAAGDR
jgi:DNA mismatch endonuclease Vsr